MPDFLFLMHGDATAPEVSGDWDAYLARLGAGGYLRGGSAVGDGRCYRTKGAPASLTVGLTGFVRVVADDLAHAATLLPGNPVYAAGGTVEIRELPVDD